MKYVVALLQQDTDYVWELYEVATDKVINTFYFEEEALEYAVFYNDGGGFAGFTPNFMLQSVTQPVTNVNDEFTRVFV
jgi:hypothetical protein